MINTTFVNNPHRSHAGNLSRYSTVTKLLFKLLQYFEALIFLMLLIFCCCLSSYTISEGRCSGKPALLLVIILRALKKMVKMYHLSQIEWREKKLSSSRHQSSVNLYIKTSNILEDTIKCVNRKNIKHLFFQMDTSHITFLDESVNMHLNELWLNFGSAGRRYAVERR